MTKQDNQSAALLSVEGLSSHFHIDDEIIRAVNDVSFEVRHNEIVGVVGESGSGKSVTAFSILRLLAAPPCRFSGRIVYKGRDLLGLDEGEMRKIRGGEISIIFQEPMTSLNPTMAIGGQIAESIRLHQDLDRKKAWKQAVEMLALVKIPEAEKRAREYPHQLSGGMRQRAMIAMALSAHPALLIADEPTTALDVTIQQQILFLIKELQARLETSVLFITHNLGVIAEVADRAIVMYAGKILEQGAVEALFHHPRHPYTAGLLRSIPTLELSRDGKLEQIEGSIPSPTRLPTGCVFSDRCVHAAEICRREEPGLEAAAADQAVRCWRWRELSGREAAAAAGSAVSGRSPEAAAAENGSLLEVRDLKKHFRVETRGVRHKGLTLKAVDGVSFDVRAGEVLGLVGESGCGKSTLGNCLVGLLRPSGGQIRFAGADVSGLSDREFLPVRKDVQIIFQDPYGSLNPRMKVRKILAEPFRVHAIARDAAEIEARTVELLERTQLNASFLNKYPHELSGGQRQRIAIARALAVSPRFIVCDEPVSALDVSVQAQIINLLEDLKRDLGLTYLFISHDLSVVKKISDRIAIMYLGKIMEIGDSEIICSRSRHPYTRALIAAVPNTDPRFRKEQVALSEEIPSPIHIPPGCRFHTRCLYARELCSRVEPEPAEVEPGWQTACHFHRELPG
jgi:peptide/nickel transport system ATP-binding protein